MATLTVRNVSDEVHRALRGRSTKAEVRAILEETVLPAGRLGLGPLLPEVGRRAKLTDGEATAFARHDSAPALPLDLE